MQQAQGRLTQSAPVGAQMQSAQAQAQLAHAKVQSAAAALQAAQLTLSYTKITADGIASKLAIRPGSYVMAGMPVVQLGSMRAGRVDMLGRREFEGKLESLSGGTGATFSVLPPDNASGNFVKVVQRVPARVSWNGPPADQVPAGSSAEVTVYTK